MSLKLAEETTTGDSSGGRKPIILIRKQYPDALEVLDRFIHSQEILLTTLGSDAPILGASIQAIEAFFEILSMRG